MNYRYYQIILQVKHLYTNPKWCEVLTGYLSLGRRPGGNGTCRWHWTKRFTVFFETGSSSSPSDFHIFFLITLLDEAFFFKKYNINNNHHRHHKHQGLDPLIRSVSRVTTTCANASSVFQLFFFLVVCSCMISKGFGFVAFFASVKASFVCIHLSCLLCL